MAYSDPTTGRSYDCNAGTSNLCFTDIATSNPSCRHVHYLWPRAVIDGCTASPAQFCPSSMVRRDQMAKFVVNRFGFTLYGP